MSLPGFTNEPFTYNDKIKPVYWGGSGPGVVVIHEIPGITPAVAGFARRVVDAGFTVAMPVLFGTPGKESSGAYAVGEIVRACISREFVCFARGKASPVTDWLRALAREVHARCGGAGVGAVGMCLTGGFALAMMVDETIMAPVLSQPSLPFAITGRHKADLGLNDAQLARVKERAATGCQVLGLRFTEDFMAPGDRFDTLRQELGDGFIGVEIDSGSGNAHGIDSRAHSVLSSDFVDEPGHPTRDAFEQVLELFERRLRA